MLGFPSAGLDEIRRDAMGRAIIAAIEQHAQTESEARTAHTQACIVCAPRHTAAVEAHWRRREPPAALHAAVSVARQNRQLQGKGRTRYRLLPVCVVGLSYGDTFSNNEVATEPPDRPTFQSFIILQAFYFGIAIEPSMRLISLLIYSNRQCALQPTSGKPKTPN